ncbi:hypothetical protein FHS43_000437 [Streptosporangium becharense]|uniref:DUF1109 domain-containing protein n=1 Tax=Streptosporangium becharense TaxID=1816182 RepID=A0A7W9MGF0_9ACTN|nr:hypothetical protein [Streptosporangium becharense]MBB2909191.1 hypothetical protein [Streptosporangium becharense]MBB5819790.1 hypothetical protein [Streptosporangium becharense]
MPRTGEEGFTAPEGARGMRPLARALVGPPSWLLLPSFTLTGLLLLYGASVPGGYFLSQVLGGLLALVLAIVWVTRFVMGLGVDGLSGLRRNWVRWAAPPVISVVVIGLIGVDAPLTARFRLSEASLERVAREVAAGGHPERDEQWVGLFHIGEIRQIEGGVSFTVKDAGLIYGEGFAWCPAGPPEPDGTNHYWHVHGPWYRLAQGF